MKAVIEHKTPKQLLTPASGFLTGYSHTLNPYVGCAFACSYCYVRRMPVALFREGAWGTWVDVKQGVSQLWRKELTRARKKGAVTIFMSSSTDPYQPIEYKEQVTRILLEAMVEDPPDFLFVQTRSPLVTRDMDLFLQMGDRVRVSVTVETDLEEIRKLFSPAAPPIPARLKAIEKINNAGIPIQATIAPLLPCSNEFAKKLSDIVDRVCLDDYFMGDGSKGKRTEQLGIRKIYKENGLESWYSERTYLRVWDQLKSVFTDEQIFISQQGFMP
jgi:DNA repair photolyase